MTNEIKTEDGIPIGNHYDKYGSSNPIARALMRGFETNVTALAESTNAADIHEVGCGEGHLAEIFSVALRPERHRVSDFSETILGTARRNLDGKGIEVMQRSIYDLEESDGAELMVCCEVLEHLEDPAAALDALHRVAQKHVILSVPREPLWRALNMARGKYWDDLGNTPGHLQHWSSSAFVRFVRSRFDIIEVRRPVPWTMLLATPRR